MVCKEFSDMSVQWNFCIFLLKKGLKYSEHPNIELTCETEKNHSLPFLDINITQEGSDFTTKLYHKPTFNGLLSKFSDFTPMLNNKKKVSTLTYRA